MRYTGRETFIFIPTGVTAAVAAASVLIPQKLVEYIKFDFMQKNIYIHTHRRIADESALKRGSSLMLYIYSCAFCARRLVN